MAREKTGSSFAKAGTYVFPILGLIIGITLLYLGLQQSVGGQLDAANMAEREVRNGKDGKGGLESTDPALDPALAKANTNLPELYSLRHISKSDFLPVNTSSFQPSYPILPEPFKEPAPDVATTTNKDNDIPAIPEVVAKETFVSAAKAWTKVYTEANAVYLFWDPLPYSVDPKPVNGYQWAIMRAEADAEGKPSAPWKTLALLDTSNNSYIDAHAQYGNKYIYAVAQAIEKMDGQDFEGVEGEFAWTKNVQVNKGTEEAPMMEATTQAITMTHGALTMSPVVDPMLSRDTTAWYVTEIQSITISTICVKWLELADMPNRSSTWVRLTYPRLRIEQGGAIGGEVILSEDKFASLNIKVECFHNGAFAALSVYGQNSDPALAAVAGLVKKRFSEMFWTTFAAGISYSYKQKVNGKTVLNFIYTTKDHESQNIIYESENVLKNDTAQNGTPPTREDATPPAEGSTPAEGDGAKPAEGDKPSEGDGSGE